MVLVLVNHALECVYLLFPRRVVVVVEAFGFLADDKAHVDVHSLARELVEDAHINL